MDLILLVLLLASTDALAQASARPGLDLVQFAWLALWAAVAGLVSFHQKVKAGATRWLNLGELVGELATSAFVGVMTGLVFESVAPEATSLKYAAAGIAGHAGGRLMFWLEGVLKAAAEKRLGIAAQPTDPEATQPNPNTPRG